jgi:hypothetical protein
VPHDRQSPHCVVGFVPVGESIVGAPVHALRLGRQRVARCLRIQALNNFHHPQVDRLLVEDRNKACIKVLQQQLTVGKKKIAIFYGAAHMPDFDKRLKEDFGMKRTESEWITAWNLADDGPRN